MSDPLRAVVLAGGLSYEREISLASGRRVTDALQSVGVEAVLRDADATLLPALAELAPDAVFIALHGGAGEDGAVRAVLDLARVRYVGSAADACRLAFDKPAAKAVVAAAGIKTPPWVALPQDTFRELGAQAVLDRLVGEFALPVVVKPVQGGSAMGATVVRTAAELPAAMVQCFAYDDTALVERHVEGTELAISVVASGDDLRALPAVEVQPAGGFFDYRARYTAGVTEYFVPARLDPGVVARAADVAVQAHHALRLRDLSRTDLIVDAAGTAWFLEVNVSPGMTETSLLPMAAAAAGVDLGVLCRDLLRAAAAR
ncbi:MAG: D-alanine--D-alanine ligase [Mycobacteriales bacterium]|nr:D-alanine--D-alanine ligase [Frankia sp.]